MRKTILRELMARLFHPVVLVLTCLLVSGYLYVISRLGFGSWGNVLMATPFVLVWTVPVLYWLGPPDRGQTKFAKAAHQASYLSMAWVSFLVVCTLARDLALLLTETLRLDAAHQAVGHGGVPAVLAASSLAMVIGALTALRGPRIEQITVRIPDLHPDLEGLRIVQISDLHVGPNIRRRYVEKVVEQCRALAPDLVALTGDMVDGPVHRLAADIAPLASLASDIPSYFVLGNHDCYSGASDWIRHFQELGVRVLLNEHTLFRKGHARLIVGGIVDPAYGAMRPDISLADAPRADLRLLLAHNPKLAPLGARAGFDLQLSGHTHAGQFFPWTLAVRLVHAPHVAGLSREGRMWVYVSAGTGSWGPPVRFGTSPEITLIKATRYPEEPVD